MATCQLYGCERANILFCDFEKGEIYKNYLDENEKENIEAFPIQKGIAGYVANTL